VVEPWQPDTSILLDLIRQHVSYYAAAVAFEPGSENARNHHEAAAGVLARITALVPQQPVQARNGQGETWWTHACGEVVPFWSAPNNDAHHCAPPCRTPGPWRPLLVGGDPINYDEPPADLRRFEAANGHPYERPFQAEEPDLMAQVMAELGVDEPGQVVGALRGREGLWRARAAEIARERDQMQENALVFMRERDEARAEARARRLVGRRLSG
jgi:hypothetical protein